MAPPATSTYLPTLEVPHERDGVGERLEATLHEPPLFRPLHLQLDELVESWREPSDTVAQRAVALGRVPGGQATAVAAGLRLAPVARGSVEDHVVVRELEQQQSMLRARLGGHT